jgi:hypothetical protein
MNREETIAAIKVMQAYVYGAEIEFSERPGEWEPCVGGPLWNWSGRDYRIKPKPLECWVLVGAGSDLKKPAFSSQQAALEASDKYIIRPRIIHLREVTE